MTRRNVIIFVLLLLFAGLFVWFAPKGKNDQNLSYAYIPSALIDAPSVAAEDLLRENKITPIPFVTGRETVQALTGGGVFAATLAEWPFLLASDKRDDLKVIAVITSAESMGILVDKTRGVETVDDLSGKRIGFPQGTSAQFMAENFLNQSGVLQNVTSINLAPPLLQPSLSRGDVDAIAIWQPFLEKARLERPDDLFYLPESQSAFRVVYCVVTTSKNIRENPDGVKRILEALIAGEDGLTSSSPEVIDKLVSKTGLEKNTLMSLTPLFRFKVTLDDEIIDTWKMLAPWAVDQKLIGEDALTKDWSNYIHSESLTEIDPSRVRLSEK